MTEETTHAKAEVMRNATKRKTMDPRPYDATTAKCPAVFPLVLEIILKFEPDDHVYIAHDRAIMSLRKASPQTVSTGMTADEVFRRS